MSFQSAFMDALKKRYTEITGEREFGGIESPSMAPYYLMHLEDNLVTDMDSQHMREYAQGSGDELGGKMKALRSSSAMTFNLLGNGPVKLNGENDLPDGIYTVEYEHRLPTLVHNPRPANLDARLERDDKNAVIYCEMKLAEWIFGKASCLSRQYLDVANYLIPKPASSVFRESFNTLSGDEIDSDGRIKPALDRYDAFQMLKHALAIYTEAHGKTESGEPLPPRIILLNCVWEMTDPHKLDRYEELYRKREFEEHAQYQEFAKSMNPIIGLFAELGIQFKVRYLPFSKMLDCLDLSMPHRNALSRYDV